MKRILLLPSILLAILIAPLAGHAANPSFADLSNGPVYLGPIIQSSTTSNTLGVVSAASITTSGFTNLGTLFSSNALTTWLFYPITQAAIATTFGAGYGSPNVSSSTFSAWGEGLGVVATNFNVIQVGIYPFNASVVPSNIVVNIRIAGTFTTNAGVNVAGVTNPATWQLLATTGTNSVSLTPLVTNLMNFSLNGTVSTNKVLSIEVIGDGYFGLQRSKTIAWADGHYKPKPLLHDDSYIWHKLDNDS